MLPISTGFQLLLEHTKTCQENFERAGTKGVSFSTEIFTPPKIIITEAFGPLFPEKSHLTPSTFFYGRERGPDPHMPPLCKINKHLPAV